MLSAPNPVTCWERREPGYRPGERMYEGEPLVFNSDLLNAYLAEEAVATAPADLRALPETDLVLLGYRCSKAWSVGKGRYDDAAAEAAASVHARVEAERTRRGLNGAFTAKAGERAA